MGFVLGKRFSGGKLICRDFHKKLQRHSSISCYRSVLFRRLWKTIENGLLSKLCSPHLPTSHGEADPEECSTNRA